MQGKGSAELESRVIRCDIYAGDQRIRSFPEDRSLNVLRAYKRNNVLVLECVDVRGKLVVVETTLPYLLIQEAPAPCIHESRPIEVPARTLPYAEVYGSA